MANSERREADSVFLEPHEHRLRLQSNAELGHHALLNFVAQCEDVSRSRAAAIYDGQRMSTRDSGCAFDVALGELRVLHQPGRRKVCGNRQSAEIARQLQPAL